MNRLTCRILLIALLSCGISIVAAGQTSSQLRSRYGQPLMVEMKGDLPVVERFLVRPDIQMTIRYTESGEPCEALFEPVANSTPKMGRPENAPDGDYMSTTAAIEVLNEILPVEKRGKERGRGQVNGGDPRMVLNHPGCTGLYFVNYENARVTAVSWCWGGTFSATVHWGKTSCPGQTLKSDMTRNKPLERTRR